jgi:hypothetical protein
MATTGDFNLAIDIVAGDRPTLVELAELAAVRSELRVRSLPVTGWWRRG